MSSAQQIQRTLQVKPPSARKEIAGVAIPDYDKNIDDMTFDPNEVYPEVPIGRGLTAQLVWITVALANEFLAVMHPYQRNPIKAHAESIARDMAAGRWRLNGEAIVLDIDGFLVNGRHRLLGIIKNNKPEFLLLIRNVSEEAYGSFDGAVRPRPAAELQRVRGRRNPSILQGTVRMLERYQAMAIRGQGSTSNIELSPLAVDEVVAANPRLEDATDVGRKLGKMCHSKHAPAFCFFVLSAVDAEAAVEFHESLLTGANLSVGNPILKLRERLNDHARRSFDTDDVVMLFFRTWNAWRTNRKLNLNIVPGDVLPSPV